jgi:nucleoside-diphosphate-sugar epimerase
MKQSLLFTGVNGFLGKNILSILRENYNVSTLDLYNADYNCNLSKEICTLHNTFDIVLHAAGKAHVIPKTEHEKQSFFDINYQGTVNLCKALEIAGPPYAFIFISTVSVYGCESGENITEEHPLKGKTQYALSKIQAEKYLTGWCKKYNVKLSILRPSLIAGVHPPGNLGSMVNGIKSGRYFSVAGGKAKKSVLMVHDIAHLIPLLVEKGGVYNVCDDEHLTFFQLEEIIAKQLGKKKPFRIPYFIAKGLALCGDLLGNKAPLNSNKLSKITKSLTFSNQKAKEILAWEPMNVLDNFKIS